MTPARFKITLALATLFGFGYLTYDYVSGRLNPIHGLSGTVFLDGKLMDKGIVRFISLDPDQPVSAGGYVENGRYTVPQEYGLPPARYQVEFSSIGQKEVQRLIDAQKRDEAPPEIKEEVPARFNRESKVEIDLRSGTVVNADFDLR